VSGAFRTINDAKRWELPRIRIFGPTPSQRINLSKFRPSGGKPLFANTCPGQSTFKKTVYDALFQAKSRVALAENMQEC
jgi:hypothetical protein